MTAPHEGDENIPIIVRESCRITVILNINDEDDNSDNKRSCGFHLSRSKWDPYPWVGCVDPGSIADIAGLRAGDCLLEIDGTDLVGLRVKDIASLVRKDRCSIVKLQVWRRFRQEDQEQEDGSALAGPLPEVAKKLAKAISGTVRALECPVCLESATSPVSQCVHGHILCVSCRAKTPRCPVCRVRLGQGRCLLADEVQRNIREAFEEISEDNSSTGASLREKLFGKINRKSHTSPGGSNGSRVSNMKLKSSLARLLLGGFDKAASAENLTIPTSVDEATSIDGHPPAYRRLGELSQNDRTKSASTGQLSKGNEPSADATNYRLGTNGSYTDTSGFLSVPQTPTWGGSTESINNLSFSCPLSRFTSCKETVTINFVLEHLSRAHYEDPQVHFYGRTAMIPLPLPFGPEATYIIHHRGEFFFFQYENEAAWIVASGTENIGEWTLLGQNGDGTEVKLRRQIARLDENSAPLSCHLAPLPKALGINSLFIKLIDSRLDEQLQV